MVLEDPCMPNSGQVHYEALVDDGIHAVDLFAERFRIVVRVQLGWGDSEGTVQHGPRCAVPPVRGAGVLLADLRSDRV